MIDTDKNTADNSDVKCGVGKHAVGPTPGPWVVEWDDVIECVDVVGGGLSVASVCGRDFDNRKANARLIAAAPDLLAALEALVEGALCLVVRCDAPRTRCDCEACDDAARARAAIAKARGNEPQSPAALTPAEATARTLAAITPRQASKWKRSGQRGPR